MKYLHLLVIFALCQTAIYADGKIQVVQNDEGKKTVPVRVVGTVIERHSDAPLPLVQSEVKTTLFEMRSQKAVLAWNGKTETLILTSENVSVTDKDEVTIGILPLPGKPLDLKYVSTGTPDNVDSLLDEKLPGKGRAVAVTGDIDTLPRLPVAESYCVFVLQIDDFGRFEDLLVNKVGEVLKQNVKIVLHEDNRNVLRRYYDKGFRYFLFDLSSLFSEYRRKHPLMVRFESNHLYYPLAICAVNGTGRSVVELTAVTPGEVKLSAAFEKELKDTRTKLTVLGNRSVDWTIEELAGIDETLSRQFEGMNSVKVRKFMFSLENVNNFSADFQAE